MAKRGVLEHPKTLALADALGIMDCFALGVLEAFWHYVAKYHEDGDITGLSPRVLCRSIRYTADAEQMMQGLIHSGFVDEIDDRLIVHDWHDHADDATHTRLYRALKRFASGEMPKPQKLGRDEKTKLDGDWAASEREVGGGSRGPGGVPAGSLPKPRPKPLPKPKPGGAGGNPGGTNQEKLLAIILEVPAFAKSPPPPGKIAEVFEDFSRLGEDAILRHAKAARDWALDPGHRYAKSPMRGADGVKFLRNWLEKELAKAGESRNGKPESEPEKIQFDPDAEARFIR